MKISTIAYLVVAVLIMACGSEEKSKQSKLEASDALVLPNQGTQGAVDARDIEAGNYRLAQVKTYTESKGSGKILYSLELSSPGDLSKAKDKFKVKSKWNEAPSKDHAWVTSVSVDAPLSLTVASRVLTFDREAIVTFQADSTDAIDWSPGDQVKTGSSALMSMIFSYAAIKENLVYKLLGKEGIAVQRSNGVSFFIRTVQDQGMTIVTELLFTKNEPVKTEAAKTESSITPVLAGGRYTTKFLRCYSKSYEVYSDVSGITSGLSYSANIGFRPRGSNNSFQVYSSDTTSASLAIVQGEYQMSLSNSAISLFVVTLGFATAIDSEVRINGQTENIESCQFLQNNIYAGKSGF